MTNASFLAVLETVKPESLVDQVVQRLRRAILTGEIPWGTPLRERDVAQQLGVSRVPVREALRLLERWGLVQIYPRRGAVVTEVSAELARDVFSVRGVLEGMVARLAAQQRNPACLDALQHIVEEMGKVGRAETLRLVDLDMQFHRTLAHSVNRPVLERTLDVLWDQTRLLIGICRDYSHGREGVVDLHQQLVDVLCSGEPDAAEAAMHRHVEAGQVVLEEYLISRIEGPASREATEGGREMTPAEVQEDKRGTFGAEAVDSVVGGLSSPSSGFV